MYLRKHVISSKWIDATKPPRASIWDDAFNYPNMDTPFLVLVDAYVAEVARLMFLLESPAPEWGLNLAGNAYSWNDIRRSLRVSIDTIWEHLDTIGTARLLGVTLDY